MDAIFDGFVIVSMAENAATVCYDSKIVEDRFVDALVNASITNDCDAFKKYLSEILVEA